MRRLPAENRLDAGVIASPAVASDAFILQSLAHLYRIDRNDE